DRRSVRCHAGGSERVDRAVAHGCGGWVPRKGNGVSGGHGGTWAIRTAVSALRFEGAADSLCGERNELPPGLPDGRPVTGRSCALETAARGLAAFTRRVGSIEEALSVHSYRYSSWHGKCSTP